jgi:hypothetical protein
MPIWTELIGAAVVLVVAGLLYVRFRWRRSPQAYRAMLVLAGCYFVAGAFAGAWIMHVTARNDGAHVVASSVAANTPGAPASPTFPMPLLHYDPVHAALPDPKLTPGDVFPGATAGNVCALGWATEHRHVTEEMRDKV